MQGGLSNLRGGTAELMQLGKTNQHRHLYCWPHVTKEGTAGPRILEHMVDTVLCLRTSACTFRIHESGQEPALKTDNEIGIFEMQSGEAVEEFSIPSQVFLEERLDGATGSSIVVAMEGTRQF